MTLVALRWFNFGVVTPTLTLKTPVLLKALARCAVSAATVLAKQSGSRHGPRGDHSGGAGCGADARWYAPAHPAAERVSVVRG